MKRTVFVAATMMALLVPSVFGSPVSAASFDPQVEHAQKILYKFGIPRGPIDGQMGAETRRGLCMFRYMSGMSTNRNTLDSSTYTKLKQYNQKYRSLNQIPVKSSSSYREKLIVNRTCQAMTVQMRDSTGVHRYRAVLAVTTGVSKCDIDGRTANCETPTGGYLLGGTNKGWICSDLFDEGCVNNSNGIFADVKNDANKPAGYGNMYNARYFKAGGYAIHGSNHISTSPQSHGCIRVSVANSDWMYRNVGNYSKPYLAVTGEY